MQRALELEALIADLYQAMAGNNFSALEQMFSRHDAALVIGTDPHEWWEQGTVFIEAMRRRMQEGGGGIPIVASMPRAYSEGGIGWAADRGQYRLPNGVLQPFRGSFVFQREEGSWRLLQWHISFPVDNDEVLKRAER